MYGAGPAEGPDVRLIMAARDYIRIRLGQLDPITAATPGGPMRGRWQVRRRCVKFAKMFRTGDRPHVLSVAWGGARGFQAAAP
jgi:hypothetical protein